jgi:flagellar hook-basal body complex protein FliE
MSGFDLSGLGGLPINLPIGGGALGGGALAQGESRLPIGAEGGVGQGMVKVGQGPIATGGRFEGLLADAIDNVQGLQDKVQDQVKAIATGQRVDLHEVMLSMGKSEVAFNLMLEVRNKLVDAWDKVSRAVV